MTQSEPTMPWEKLLNTGREMGLLCKEMYAVSSLPTNGLGPVLAIMEEHVAYQVKLEKEGVMWAAGPFDNDTAGWDGEGFFVYRASSKEEAIEFAAADPMHKSGARSFRVRTWMLNEGSFQLQVDYSTGKVRLL